MQLLSCKLVHCYYTKKTIISNSSVNFSLMNSLNIVLKTINFVLNGCINMVW